MDVNKQLTHQNDYDRVVDVLKNTNSKGLTHEVVESRQSHLSAIVKDALP